jgi:hypothetical protein
VEHLRCEYRENPLGIESAQPRLSWWLRSDVRGQRQAAYQVLVASSPDVLARGEGDLWDSWRKASERGPGEGSCRGGKAPKKGPPHLTDVLCLEMVPDAGVRRDVDGGTL